MNRLFRDIFSRIPQVRASAPGRVNLIGEHTDYNGGFVLPMAIPQMTKVELAVRQDNVVNVVSNSLDHENQAYHYDLGTEMPRHTWLDYILGMTQFLQEKNIPIQGFDALISSNIPIGAGLASSAALLVSLLQALREGFAIAIDDVEVAIWCQEVENGFVGAKVGIMDQMAASLAEVHAALFLDTFNLVYESIPVPDDMMEIFVINSGIRHSHASGSYNTRRMECEQACRRLGVDLLREVSSLNVIHDMPEPLGRRVRHVVTEDRRVLAAVSALKKHDAYELGRLMIESHQSMRDDYEVSIAEIDFLVEESIGIPEVYGARLTGGGFGGSIVGICEVGSVHGIVEKLVASYRQVWGRKASVLIPS